MDKIVILMTIAVAVQARIEILCGEKALYFKAEASDLNGWPARKIRVGKCRLNPEYTVSADYEECGLMVAESEKTIEVRTTVLSDKLKSAITRKRPVELIISCEYNINKRQSSKVAIRTVIGKIGGYVSRQGKVLDIDIKYVDKSGEIHGNDEENVKKELGEDVTAIIDGPNLSKLGLIASASDCFVSPDAVPDEHSLKYYLLRDMCPEDETLKIERYGTGQKITFKTFKFAHSSDSFLYLHCDILACTSKTSCGTCIKRWRNISAVWIKTWNNRIRKQMVFDVTTIQPLTRDNIRCGRDGIRFMAKPSDFPRWNGDELQIGTCRLSSDFTGFASYEKCGIKTQERRKFLLVDPD
ncbi:CUB and zona pellucida-like domain-containing protein 1 [Clytia hemisphaerica]|uniref:CUB and zona pellucida-like domain-containing protein 1 n=1 Tax=Clytia hemisphaerica TaxID=252671 RepID=UPI0034D53253